MEKLSGLEFEGRSSRHAPFRILCVDRDPAFLRVLRLTFERHGMEVITAASGIEAFMQFETNNGQFDAVLADQDSRAAKILSFLNKVRSSGYEGRILIMSGGMSPFVLRACMRYGINGFFSKPFDIGMMATLLREEQNSSPPAESEAGIEGRKNNTGKNK